MGGNDDEVRSLKRGLLFYRAVTALLLAGIGVVGWKLAGPRPVSTFGAPDEVWTVDLVQRRADVEAKNGDLADFSETYFQSPGASVHMHFMGHLQTTPLHLHPNSEEATIVAGGTAEVTHVWGEDGAFRTRQGSYATGSLIASPRSSAHEFHNPDEHAMLANLVFTAPMFGGNFYVHPDDPRILAGAAPSVTIAADDLAAFTTSGAPFRLVALPAIGGRMSELLVATTWTLPGDVGKPIVAYVAAGEGSVDGRPLKAGTLAHLASSSPITITATQPLALVLFDPNGALGAATVRR